MWPFKLHRDQAALVRMRQSRDYWKTRAIAAERQRDASWDLSSQQSRVIREQGATVAGLRDQLAEATGPNAVTADNDRLAKELAAEKADSASKDRRWFGHIASCGRANLAEEQLAARGEL